MLKIERLNIVNKQRGIAFVMARFDVNLGPVTIKGFELVKIEGSVKASPPYNLYTPKGESKPKRFTYVFFNGDRGQQMERAVFEAAMEEYARRGGNNSQPQQGYGQPQGGYNQPQSYGQGNNNFGGNSGGGYGGNTGGSIADADDDLPF